MARVPGSVAIRSRRASVRALIGLNDTLPSSFTHISRRIERTGARTPAEISALPSARMRSVFSPEGSPSVHRFP